MFGVLAMTLALAGCAAGGELEAVTGQGFGGAPTTGAVESTGTGSSGDVPPPSSDTDLPPVDWTTSSTGAEETSSGGSETGDSSSGDSSGETAPEVILPCDFEYTFEPAAPGPGTFFVEVSDPDPLTYVGLTLVGPNTVYGEFVDVVAEEPWAWRFEVEGHVPGEYALEFSSAQSEDGPRTTWATCSLEVQPVRR